MQMHGYKKNTTVSWPVSLVRVADGMYGQNPTEELSKFRRSVNGGVWTALTNPPVISPSGGTDGDKTQIVITLDVAETPGPWTSVRYVDTADPKVYIDNEWVVHLTNVGSGSGSVITVNPSAFIDAEAVANLVGPYVANLLINSLNLPTAGEWAQILAQNALITAIKSKTDLMTFTSSLLQTTVHNFNSTAQADLKTQVFEALRDPTKTMTELTGAPPALMTWEQAMAWLVAKSVNGGEQNDDTQQVYNSSGIPIAEQSITRPGTPDASIIYHRFESV